MEDERDDEVTDSDDSDGSEIDSMNWVKWTLHIFNKN